MTILFIGIGGFAGSIGRYLVGRLLFQATDSLGFPFGTLAINVGGCLVIGFLGGLVVERSLLSSQARTFLMTGLLGGFTTFSAFGLETLTMLQTGRSGTAALYVVGSVVLGLLAVWAGYFLAKV